MRKLYTQKQEIQGEKAYTSLHFAEIICPKARDSREKGIYELVFLRKLYAQKQVNQYEKAYMNLLFEKSIPPKKFICLELILK